MRNLFLRIVKHQFDSGVTILCPLQRYSMATNLSAPSDEQLKRDETNVEKKEDQNKKVTNKRPWTNNDDFKAKRTKQEEEDGKIMQSRREMGLPYKRKKMAMMMMYSGKNYYGMQVQREDQKSIYKTIESDLFEALSKAGVIIEEHAADQKGIKFQRAARTDKGVSAAGQVCSLMIFTEVENPVEKINDHLPADIRVLDIKRATKGFDAKNDCDSRTYSYLLPTFALCPIEENVVETFRVKDETIKRTNEILALYKGTHNFHNYTSGKKPSDPSAKRYIIDMRIGQPFVQNGLEFASIIVKGQSFMLHQIRKMIGLMIAIVRGLASLSAIQNSWRPVRTDVPRAPGLGLLLEQVHYNSYNKKFSKTHDDIDCAEYKDKIEAFKKEHIYSTMIETEKNEKSMMNWLQTLHAHHFGEVQTDHPISAETAIGHALSNVVKAKMINEKSPTESDVESSNQDSEKPTEIKSQESQDEKYDRQESNPENAEGSQKGDAAVKSENS